MRHKNKLFLGSVTTWSFQDAKLSAASVAPTSEFRACAMSIQ